MRRGKVESELPLLAPADDARPRLLPYVSVLASVALYLVVGPALILVNKEILTSIGFGFPMLVSGLGQFTSAIGSFLVIRVFKLQPLTITITWDFYLKNMVVVGAAFASSLSFGNAGYMFLTVSFVQILKAFTPCAVVAMLWVTRVERPSLKVIGSVAAMSVGTAIAAFGELNFNLVGFLIMCCAELSEATRLVLTQKLLKNIKMSVFEGLYYMAPICCVWMWGLALFVEVPRLVEEQAHLLILNNLPTFLFAAVLGFLVNVASFLVIKATSGVMVKLLGTARNAGLVLFSAVALGEQVSAVQAGGYGICLAAFALYNYLKLYSEPAKLTVDTAPSEEEALVASPSLATRVFNIVVDTKATSPPKAATKKPLSPSKAAAAKRQDT